MKEELVSLSTHELRAPITAIKGYLTMVLDGDTGGVNEETKTTLQEVLSVNQRLADLVDDLLECTRIEQNRLKVILQDVDFSLLVTQAVREFEPQAKARMFGSNFQTAASLTLMRSHPT